VRFVLDAGVDLFLFLFLLLFVVVLVVVVVVVVVVLVVAVSACDIVNCVYFTALLVRASSGLRFPQKVRGAGELFRCSDGAIGRGAA
jgi:hypothetical protein